MSKQISKEEVQTIIEIAIKADHKGLLARDRLTLMMDLEHVHENIGLRLDDLANADGFNFTHDIVGIQNNINRETGQLENCFLPRYSARNK